MRLIIATLIMTLCTAAFPADKISLEAFVDSLRDQLTTAGAGGSDPATEPLRITKLHVEVNVTVETDESGNRIFYIVNKDAIPRGLITQKLAFDVELPANGTLKHPGPGYRSYSTNKPENRYATDHHQVTRHRTCNECHDQYRHEIKPWISPRLSPTVIPNERR